LKRVEFKDPGSAIIGINRWISEKSNNRITGMLHPGDINAATRLLLSNVVYFKEEWLNKFDKKRTKPGIFFSGPKNQYAADFMENIESLQYFETKEYQFISKPYKGSVLSFCMILPKKMFGIEEIESQLNNDLLNKILDSSYNKRVDLIMPKIKIESNFELQSALQKAGLLSAFSNRADFTGITRDTFLMLGKVIQKTWLELDEEKTEAAAATTTMMITGIQSYRIFKADHPFVFFVMDNGTRAIVFMGRYTAPEGKEIAGRGKDLRYNLESRKAEEMVTGKQRLLYVVNRKIVSEAEMKAINFNHIESVHLYNDKEHLRKYPRKYYDAVIEMKLKSKRSIRRELSNKVYKRSGLTNYTERDLPKLLCDLGHYYQSEKNFTIA
jgi:serpin B